MKLINKLIPIATVITATTAVVPLGLSSCSGNMKNIYGMEEPSFEQFNPPEEYIQDDVAVYSYVEFMKKHPKAFVEDMKWGIYQNWLSFLENSNYSLHTNNWHEVFNSKINSLKCYVSKPKFGTVNVNTGKLVEDFPTLSFKMNIDAEFETNTIFGVTQSISKNHKIKISSEIEYDNMLFFAYPATRNDKTHGKSTLSPDDLPVDTTKPGWFITISEDADVQYRYRKNFNPWGIKYKFDFEDELTTDDSGNKTTVFKTASYDTTVDTYVELERLIGLKTYHYEAPIFDPYEFEYYGPNEAWFAWFDQKAESVLANTVLLDCVTHYLDKCDSQCYMYVPEHLSGDYVPGGSGPDISLSGALYYPNSKFTYADKNKYELTLEIYDDEGWVEETEPIRDIYNIWLDDAPTIQLHSGSSKTAEGQAIYELLPDWEAWAINKGAASTPIQNATLDITAGTLTGINTLEFVLGSNYRLKFNIHPRGYVGYQGEWHDPSDETKKGMTLDLQLNDGNGTIFVNVIHE